MFHRRVQPPALRRGQSAVLLTGALVTTSVLGSAIPASAVVNTPPVGHVLTVFPSRDFVSADGYSPGQPVVFEVWRAGHRVGVSRPVQAGSDGIAEVNHPGGGCWSTVTPDIRAGDEVRVLTDTSTADPQGDAIPVSYLTVQRAVLEGGDVVVHGTAEDAAGRPLPIVDLEVQIRTADILLATDKRRISALGDGTGEGDLSYDAAGSSAWTARFSGLASSDRDQLLDGVSRITDLAVATGLTIQEANGDPAGPTPECAATAPFASGPTGLAMTPDTGSSAADGITATGDLTFTGLSGGLYGASVELLEGSTVLASQPVPAGLTSPWSLTPATLAPGQHRITAQVTEAVPAGTDPVTGDPITETVVTRSAETLTVVVDTTAPAVSAAAPAVLTADNTPTLTYSSADPSVSFACVLSQDPNAVPVAPCPPSGSAYDTVPDGSYTFRVRATDLAGNAAEATAPFAVDATGPAAPTGVAITGLTPTTATLTWAPATDPSGIRSYTVLRNGVQVATVTGAEYHDAGLAASTAYSYQVVAIDSLGNASVGSAPVRVTTPAPPDTTGPTAPTSVGRVLAGGLVGPASGVGANYVPVSVSWAPAKDASGIATYTVQVSVNGGAWKTLGRTAATSYVARLAPGTVRFRVQATDRNGNVGAFGASAPMTVRLTQESGASVAYAGSWGRVSSPALSGLAARQAAPAGRSVRVTFTGTSVAWVGTRTAASGRATVYLDGRYAGTVDQYSPASATRSVAFVRNGLAAKAHVLEIRTTGTKQAASRGTLVSVDAFVTG